MRGREIGRHLLRRDIGAQRLNFLEVDASFLFHAEVRKDYGSGITQTDFEIRLGVAATVTIVEEAFQLGLHRVAVFVVRHDALSIEPALRELFLTLQE